MNFKCFSSYLASIYLLVCLSILAVYPQLSIAGVKYTGALEAASSHLLLAQSIQQSVKQPVRGGLQRSVGRRLTMSEAIAIAERRSEGRVLSAREGVDRSGEPVYYVKVLSKKGVVRTIKIRANR